MTLLVNELKNRLKTEPDGTERVDILNALAFEIKENISEALKLVEESGSIATRLDYHKGVAFSSYVQASIWNVHAEYTKAIEAAANALVLSDEIKDRQKQSEVLELMGQIQKNSGDYKAALDFYQQSLAIVRELNIEEREADLLKKVANIHLSFGNYDQAIELYRQGLSIVQQLNDEHAQSVILNNMGTAYRHLGEHETALEYFEKSFSLKKILNDERGQANTLTNIGLVYKDIGMYPKALESYQKSLPIIQKLNDRYREASILSNIGVVYRQIGHFPKALEFFLNSLNICRLINIRRNEAEVLNNIGLLYLESDDAATALDYLGKSLEIWHELGDKRSEAVTLDSIGGSYFKSGDYDTALDNLKTSLEITRFSGDGYTASNTLSDIANVYSAQGKTSIALEYFNESFELAEKVGYKHRQSEALLGIGEIYVGQQEPEKALDYLRRSLRLAEELGARELLYRIHLSLSYASEQLGLLRQTLNHLRAHQRFKEEIFNEESDKTFKKLQAVHEVETAKREAELYRLKTVELAKLNEQLSEAISEKNEILGIAAHDLKNPLGAILLTSQHIESSLSDMPSELVIKFMGNVTKTADDMLSIVNKMLQSEEFESEKLILCPEIIDIKAITNDVVEYYLLKAKEKNIDIQYESDGEKVTVFSDPVASKQIIDNLVSNAVKFAPHETTVTVSLQQTGTLVQFSVKDEGPGLSDKDKESLFKRFSKLTAKPTGGEHSTGLGLSIVKKLVDKLQGRVWCESELGMGARFIVELPRFSNE